MSTLESHPYTPHFERGGCGVGFVADRHGRASREILNLGIDALINLQHRGALNADAKTGDGAGILVPLPAVSSPVKPSRSPGTRSIPTRWPWASSSSIRITSRRHEASPKRRCTSHGLQVVAWRDVPVDPDGLGDQARVTMPRIVQAIIQPQACHGRSTIRTATLSGAQRIRTRSRAANLEVYVPSLSSRTIVYKGLLLAPQIRNSTRPHRRRFRSAAGRLSSALQHQHLPHVGARAAVPRAVPQRRDQHAARQPRVDARARADSCAAQTC